MVDKYSYAEKILHQELEGFSHFGLKVPWELHGGIVNYAIHHTAAGDFLTGVITNDLGKTMSHGTFENLQALPAIYSFFYNRIPSECWGSKEKMASWLVRRKK